MTLTDGAGVGGLVVWQLTLAVPPGPVCMSGIDELLPDVEVPVTIVTLRDSVFEPTVSVQLTLTRWLIPEPVTVTVGLARAR